MEQHWEFIQNFIGALEQIECCVRTAGSQASPADLRLFSVATKSFFEKHDDFTTLLPPTMFAEPLADHTESRGPPKQTNMSKASMKGGSWDTKEDYGTHRGLKMNGTYGKNKLLKSRCLVFDLSMKNGWWILQKKKEEERKKKEMAEWRMKSSY